MEDEETEADIRGELQEQRMAGEKTGGEGGVDDVDDAGDGGGVHAGLVPVAGEGRAGGDGLVVVEEGGPRVGALVVVAEVAVGVGSGGARN